MTSLARIPPSELRLHNKRDDAWAAFNGKVYNITPYLDFHPGGEKELMRVAGRDGTKLFCTSYSTLGLFDADGCYSIDPCVGQRRFYVRCLLGWVFGPRTVILDFVKVGHDAHILFR